MVHQANVKKLCYFNLRVYCMISRKSLADTKKMKDETAAKSMANLRDLLVHKSA